MLKLTKGLMVKGVLAATLAATTLATAAPAQAHDYYRGRGGNNDAALAIGAGVVGLAIGAAIASDRSDRYYDRGYYDRGYYSDDYDSYPVYRGGYYYDSYPRYRGYDDRGWREHEWREHRGRDHGWRGRRGW